MNNTQDKEYTAAAAHAQRHLGHAKGECRHCKGDGRVWCAHYHDIAPSFMGCSNPDPCPLSHGFDNDGNCTVPCPNCDGGEG